MLDELSESPEKISNEDVLYAKRDEFMVPLAVRSRLPLSLPSSRPRLWRRALRSCLLLESHLARSDRGAWWGGRLQAECAWGEQHLSREEKKMKIGNALYQAIAAQQPELAAKLTGMFLDATDCLEDLVLLIFSPSSLELHL